MPRALLACAVALALASLLAATPGRGQALTGSVRGAEAINVRRGPGPETPAFAVLRRGASVTVEEQAGQWARVVLPDGERGWVNVAFLELPAGATLAPAAVDGTPADAAAAPQPAAAPAAPSFDDELARLRERLASLESVVVPTPSPTPALPGPDRDLPTHPPILPTVVAPPATLDVGPALALAGLGFVLGFLLGTFYGQRQERRGRSRVRF